MKNTILILILLLTTMLITSCTEDTTGTETLNEKITVYLPDGVTPAPDATVEIYAIGDTSTSPVHQLSTDANGQYDIDWGSKSSGLYNIIAEYDDSLYTMQDSVFISSESNGVQDDTLGAPGSISGVVALQPNHSHLLHTVYVVALGMGRALNVDSTGWFTLPKLAPGEYDLQIETSLEKYGPKFVNVSIAAGVDDKIADTIVLPYSDIPVVSGLTHSYDTLNGIVTLNWNKSNYGDVSNYLIYKKSSSTLNWSESQYGWVPFTDTVYQDTIFTYEIKDLNSTFFWDYTVAIMDNSAKEGLKYKYTSVEAVSPLQVTSTFDVNLWNKTEGKFMDTVSTSDSISLFLKLQNPTRPYKSVKWSVAHPDSLVKENFFSSTSSSAFDSLVYYFDVEGNHEIYLLAEDSAGTKWYNTVTIPVWNFPDTITLKLDSMFTYSTQLSWSKSKSEDFNHYSVFITVAGTAFNTMKPDTILTNINDTTVYLTGLYDNQNYNFIVSVTNKKGIIAYSNMINHSTKSFTTKLSDGPTNIKTNKSLSYDNVIYVLNSYQNTIQTYDTESNSWGVGPTIPTNRVDYSAIVLDDNMYIIGGYNPSDTSFYKTVHKYSFLINEWSEAAPTLTECDYKTAFTNEGKIYAISRRLTDAVYRITIEVYDPLTNTWSHGSDIKGSITYQYGWMPVTINEETYLVTYAGEGYTHYISKFDPSTFSLAGINSASKFWGIYSAFELNGEIVIGGYCNGVYGLLQHYNIKSNLFSNEHQFDYWTIYPTPVIITNVSDKVYLIKEGETSIMAFK